MRRSLVFALLAGLALITAGPATAGSGHGGGHGDRWGHGHKHPGGPLGSTKPLVLMIYQTAFNSYAMGYAAAQTVVLFTILLVVSLIQLWVLREKK